MTETYQLEELRAFFGAMSPNEALIYGEQGAASALTMDCVNERLPMECFRSNPGSYAVYQVFGGGYFYMFWCKTTNPHADEKYRSEQDDTAVYFTVYISDLKEMCDFDAIEAGKSTAEDVARIDPALEFLCLRTCGIYSYSLLNDGSILEIQYEWYNEIESQKDLIVTSKNILPDETAKLVSNLATIR